MNTDVWKICILPSINHEASELQFRFNKERMEGPEESGNSKKTEESVD